MTQLQLKIHRGTHEVGGTCIEVSAGQSRIVLDVGLPLFDQDRQPLDGFSLRRKSKAELQADGLLPQVPGLFDDGPTPDAILLSHAHLDHTGLLGHSHPKIPVYASRGTSKMMLAGGIFSAQIELAALMIAECNCTGHQERAILSDLDLNVSHFCLFLFNCSNEINFGESLG